MVTINFLYVNIGCLGQVFDGVVFKKAGFYELPEESLLDLPDMCTLPGREKLCPRVFIRFSVIAKYIKSIQRMLRKKD